MMTFKDQAPAYGYEVVSQPDPSYAVNQKGDDTLQGFFGRPIPIKSFEWGTGTTFFQTFNPWTDFWTNPRNVNRIANYKNLRAKLCVKFLINGNGFHYGRLIASYTPLPDYDDLTVTRAFFRQDVIQASQKPHVYLDPTTSSGGTLCLPFFWFYNYLNTTLDGWDQMGEINISSINNLKHANGATDRVTITVMAWAEDVQMTNPTSISPPALTPQMGDEYGSGPVSRPASVLARWAGALRDAPVIGMYARATEIAANAASAVATTFGYSRPILVDNVMQTKPTLVGNMANTNLTDTSQKLSLDCKQEGTVDPRTTGLSNVDEMTIKSVATRESYYATFLWETTKDPTQDLFTTKVQPSVMDYLTGPQQDEVHMPACCFAALPFQYWRGTMKFRFQVVASNYHKGRLRITYDPERFTAASAKEYNLNYNYIVDIAESKDFTVEIGWGSDRPYLQVEPPNAAGDPTYRNDFWTVGSGTLTNGILKVDVVNALTVPNSEIDNNVEVNVFVSCGDDIEFRAPWSQVIERMDLAPTPPPALTAQAGDEPQADAEATDEPSKPMSQTPDGTMAGKLDETDATSMIFFGEEIVSFRQCLKRYCRHYIDGMTAQPSGGVWTRTQYAFPFHKGYVPGAITPSVSGQYNYSFGTMLNYISPAYSGWRGGIRWKFVTTGVDTFDGTNGTVSVRRNNNIDSYDSTYIADGSQNVAEALQRARTTEFPTWDGAYVTPTSQNPCAEVEIPYQLNTRFVPARENNWTTGVLLNQFEQGININVRIPNLDISDVVRQDCHVAVAEDFSLFFFQGAPIMYFNVPVPNVPPPARGPTNRSQ